MKDMLYGGDYDGKDQWAMCSICQQEKDKKERRTKNDDKPCDFCERTEAEIQAEEDRRWAAGEDD